VLRGRAGVLRCWLATADIVAGRDDTVSTSTWVGVELVGDAM